MYVARCNRNTHARVCLGLFIGFFRPSVRTALRGAIHVGGDILIKFHDGAVYDGPYVSEACLDLKGTVPSGERRVF